MANHRTCLANKLVEVKLPKGLKSSKLGWPSQLAYHSSNVFSAGAASSRTSRGGVGEGRVWGGGCAWHTDACPVAWVKYSLG